MTAYSSVWLRAAVERFRVACPQRTLGGRVALSNEQVLDNVVLAALGSAVMMEERDDQQAIIRVCEDICLSEGIRLPVPETFRRKIQFFQNTVGFAGVSERERLVRDAKRAYVAGLREVGVRG